MFTQLRQRIQKLAQDRHWEKYHHPKNLLINTFIEFSELAEHLISPSEISFEQLKNDSKKFNLVCEELGDLLINFIQFSESTKISLTDCPPANLPLSLSPAQVSIRLLVVLGHLAEPLAWASEQESRSFAITEEMPEILKKGFSIALFFAKQMGVCPLKTSMEKIAKIEKKYPIEGVKENVNEYYRKKAKYRT